MSAPETPETDKDIHRRSNRATATATGPALLDWRGQWDRLTSHQRLRAKQIGVAALVGVAGFGLYSASSGGSKQATPPPAASKLDMGAGLRGDSLEVKLRGDLKKIIDGQALLGERVTAIEEGKLPSGETSPGLEQNGDQGLPPALPGEAPTYPPAPADASNYEGLPPPPAVPEAPAAPPAPSVERQIGAIGTATSAAPAPAASGEGSKKSNARSICRLVS
jgi:conjugal transfer pilus assembly protein TraB